MTKQQRISLYKVISFWSYKRERVKNMHLLSDYYLLKIALKKFAKHQVRNLLQSHAR